MSLSWNLTFSLWPKPWSLAQDGLLARAPAWAKAAPRLLIGQWWKSSPLIGRVNATPLLQATEVCATFNTGNWSSVFSIQRIWDNIYLILYWQVETFKHRISFAVRIPVKSQQDKKIKFACWEKSSSHMTCICFELRSNNKVKCKASFKNN